MATDFDAIAEAIITQCGLEPDASWILSPGFSGSLQSGSTWHSICESIREALRTPDDLYQPHFEVIKYVRASQDELAFVRALAPEFYTRVDQQSNALYEFIELAQDCLFALVVRKLRLLVTA